MAPHVHHFPPMCRAGIALLLFVALVTVQGCAALTLPALAPAALGGAGEVVKSGTEQRKSGMILRTFSLPLVTVRESTLATLRKLQLEVRPEEPDRKDRRILATANGRVVDARFEELTPVMSRVRLVVKEGVWSRDRATASELLAQIERTIEQRAPTSVTK